METKSQQSVSKDFKPHPKDCVAWDGSADKEIRFERLVSMTTTKKRMTWDTECSFILVNTLWSKYPVVQCVLIGYLST